MASSASSAQNLRPSALVDMSVEHPYTRLHKHLVERAWIGYWGANAPVTKDTPWERKCFGRASYLELVRKRPRMLDSIEPKSPVPVRQGRFEHMRLPIKISGPGCGKIELVPWNQTKSVCVYGFGEKGSHVFAILSKYLHRDGKDYYKFLSRDEETLLNEYKLIVDLKSHRPYQDANTDGRDAGTGAYKLPEPPILAGAKYPGKKKFTQVTEQISEDANASSPVHTLSTPSPPPLSGFGQAQPVGPQPLAALTHASMPTNHASVDVTTKENCPLMCEQSGEGTVRKRSKEPCGSDVQESDGLPQDATSKKPRLDTKVQQDSSPSTSVSTSDVPASSCSPSWGVQGAGGSTHVILGSPVSNDDSAPNYYYPGHPVFEALAGSSPKRQETASEKQTWNGPVHSSPLRLNLIRLG
ncbi:hypothetical protein MPH_12099 [Macrophomina phaseolina MS6]|uniref:Uncharacterized protein n=1 Tax=Macrophomina phaseolina (strain MS6) TaxID=1126212 RepID=K2R8R1_MACPH|nr:hypothetical protein MPH_12099 [Macrophomina phaseolina MS6]